MGSGLIVSKFTDRNRAAIRILGVEVVHIRGGRKGTIIKSGVGRRPEKGREIGTEELSPLRPGLNGIKSDWFFVHGLAEEGAEDEELLLGYEVLVETIS